MNILFFLSPKQDLMYVYDDFTLRQTLEKWENNRYAPSRCSTAGASMWAP